MNVWITRIAAALAVGKVDLARIVHADFTDAATTDADRWWVHYFGNAIQRELCKQWMGQEGAGGAA